MEVNRFESHNGLTCVILFCVACCLFLVDHTYAQEIQKSIPIVGASGDTPPEGPSWGSSPARPDKFDWIQLTSGEWLKGDLKALYDDTLEFDSDNLELLEFDWYDIKQIRGHKPQSIRFEGRIIVVGILTVIDDKVSIFSQGEELEFDRRNLVSIAPGYTSKIHSWSAKISIDLDVRKGNSEQVNYNTFARAERRTSKSRFHIDYLGILNKTGEDQTANSQRINSYFDIFLSRRLYWRSVFGEYFRDPFSNIENRSRVGMGVGYHIIDTPKTELGFAFGFAAQNTQNVSAEAGKDSYSSTPVLELITEYDVELTRKIDFGINYRLDVVNQESGRYLHHAVATLEINLTRHLDLDLSMVWDRIENPKLKDDGLIPDQNDFHFLIGIGFEI